MDLGERSGNRAVGIGEVPYFDPRSTSKAAALGKEQYVKSNATANGFHSATSHGSHGMAGGGHGMAKGGCSGGNGIAVKDHGGAACPSQSGTAAGAHGNGMAH